MCLWLELRCEVRWVRSGGVDAPMEAVKAGDTGEGGEVGEMRWDEVEDDDDGREEPKGGALLGGEAKIAVCASVRANAD